MRCTSESVKTGVSDMRYVVRENGMRERGISRPAAY